MWKRTSGEGEKRLGDLLRSQGSTALQHTTPLAEEQPYSYHDIINATQLLLFVGWPLSLSLRWVAAFSVDVDRGRDGGDLVARIVRAALIQVRAAGRPLHTARPVAGHVQRPILGRFWIFDCGFWIVEVAASKFDQAVDSIITVQFVPAVGQRVFPV